MTTITDKDLTLFTKEEAEAVKSALHMPEANRSIHLAHHADGYSIWIDDEDGTTTQITKRGVMQFKSFDDAQKSKFTDSVVF